MIANMATFLLTQPALEQRPAAAANPSYAARKCFTINGRFLTQPVTGVQRYALEVTREILHIAATEHHEVGLVAPRNFDRDVAEPAGVSALGPLHGHLWEQLTLPLRRRERLVNLCNMAPLLARDNVVCVHDANVFSSPESYSPTFGRVYRALLPILARRAKEVATVTRHAATELSRHLDRPVGQFHILPNGHEHVYRWMPERSVLATEIESWRPFVLLVGSLARHKNIELILALAAALAADGLDIVVVGTRHGPFSSTSETCASNVRYLGRVHDDDLACLMDRALCLAFPSLQEGFGIPIIEAMARGCPVVASSASCLPEICGNAALLASPRSSAEWLRQFRRLQLSKGLREDLTGRGLDNVRQFSWKRTALGYFDLLQS